MGMIVGLIQEKGTAMRMNDQEYFRSCIAKERQLAQLLGHQHIEECYESAGSLWDKAQVLPQWTRDWQACGPLLARYRVALSFAPAGEADGSAGNNGNNGNSGTPGCAGGTVTAGGTTVTLTDHPSPERALMYAIVKEVVHRLEHHHVARPEAAAPLHPHP